MRTRARSRHLTSVARLAAAMPLVAGCLPEDTRPEPATIVTRVALAPRDDTDFTDGVRFATTDGYEIVLERIIMSFGRVTFYGDDCNLYARGQGFYSRVLDALQPGEQLVSLNYALGQCKVQFRLYPPEDWAHVDNAGITEQDRDALRAVEFDRAEVSAGREESDDFLGTRGPRGATLSVAGTALSLEGEDAPVRFRFDFGVPSFAPKCAPPGRELFEFAGGDDVSLVVEMLPEELFGTCGDTDELRFAPVARARALVEPGAPVTLDTLKEVRLGDLSAEGEQEFYVCDRSEELGAGAAPMPDGADSSALAEAWAEQSLRSWLNLRVNDSLFTLRDAECAWQPPTFEEQF